MNYEQLGTSILKAVGGKSNVSGFTHCATRLRFTLKDEGKADEQTIKQLDGVLGVAKSGGQFQVIIGNAVPKVFKEINAQLGTLSGGSTPTAKKKIIDRIFDFIPAIFTPILPAIIGAGLIKSVLALAVLFGINTEGNLYYFINFIGDAPLFFLPVMLAFTTAKKLGVNQFIAVAIAGAMLHPDYRALVTDAFNLNFVSVSGVPVTLASYNASVIPVILMVFALKYFDQLLDKIIPQMLQFFFKPLLSILVVSAITFTILGPLGFVTGIGISTALSTIEGYAGWLVPTIIGIIFPLMVTTGMHYGLVPFMMQSIATSGYETIAGPGNLPSNIAQGAASLAVAFRTKNKELRKTGLTTGTTALLGVTEPALFAVTLKYKKVLTSVMIGGGLGGFYAGITGVKCFSFCSPGLLSLVAYIGPNGWGNVIHASISMVIGFVTTFAAVWFWGYKDILDEDQEVASNEAEVFSPLDGTVMELTEVPDEIFSTGMLGKGFAVVPSNGQVTAPVSGKVINIFPTKHAIGLLSDQGVEILIHIGLDTVNLGGQGFHTKVQVDDQIEMGDLLVEVDLDMIQQAGFNPITMIVITNSDQFPEIHLLVDQATVSRGGKVAQLTKKASEAHAQHTTPAIS